MESETYAALNRAWKDTCRVVLGSEIGDMNEYETWLKGMVDTTAHGKSSISGKEITYIVKEYEKNSKWISFDEIDFNKKFEPLDINEIKDIDSIVEAVKERAYYCGNIILGNSKFVEKSSNVTDCFYIYETAHFADSKYLAFCTVGRESNNCFGVYGPGETEFCIRCTQTYRDKRCFELWMSQNCSDCYYIYDLDNCSNCMFSFGIQNKRHCIGNLELDKDKYAGIKQKLLEEMVEELKQKKQLPSLLDIVMKGEFVKPPEIAIEDPHEKFDKDIIEKEFTTTADIVLGTKLKNIDDYADWLTQHVHKNEEVRSVISGKRILMQPYTLAIQTPPKDRIVDIAEARAIGEKVKLNAEEIDDISMKNVHKKINKLAYFNVEIREGNNKNLIDCTMSIDSTDCYKASATVYSKYCGCGMWPKSSSNCFGLDTLFDSNFCIDCYHSMKLVRCFEMDNCRNCSDSMFCHNCENVHDSMFCFNAKNLRNAIGNAVLPLDQYKKVKKMLMEQIASELEKNKKLKWSIYNVGELPG